MKRQSSNNSTSTNGRKNNSNLKSVAAVNNKDTSISAAEQKLSVVDPRRWWLGYVYILGRYPWSVQLVSGAFLSTLGSIISECVVQHKSFSQIDWTVPARMILMGIFVFGPIIRTWMLFLERLVPGKRGWAGVKKMLIDQLIMPPILLVLFTSCFVLMQGGSLANVAEKLQKDWWTMLKNNWKLWPAVQLISFYLIPFDLRMVFMQTVALVWNVYIAFMFSSSSKSTPASTEDGISAFNGSRTKEL